MSINTNFPFAPGESAPFREDARAVTTTPRTVFDYINAKKRHVHVQQTRGWTIRVRATRRLVRACVCEEHDTNHPRARHFCMANSLDWVLKKSGLIFSFCGQQRPFGPPRLFASHPGPWTGRPPVFPSATRNLTLGFSGTPRRLRRCLAKTSRASTGGARLKKTSAHTASRRNSLCPAPAPRPLFA